eukprot:1150057-Pelagomonas_calceolata.AAC.1
MLLFWSKDFKSRKLTQFDAVGGQEWRLGGQKVGFTPWLNRHKRRKLGLFNSITRDRKTFYILTPSLSVPGHGAPMLGACLKHLFWGRGSCPALLVYLGIIRGGSGGGDSPQPDP